VVFYIKDLISEEVKRHQRMRYFDLKFLSSEVSISVFTLRKFIKMGLPHFRVGRKILVNPDEFKAWFEEHHRASTEPENHGLDQIVSKAIAEVGGESP
jgi:hypothetical protein